MHQIGLFKHPRSSESGFFGGDGRMHGSGNAACKLLIRLLFMMALTGIPMQAQSTQNQNRTQAPNGQSPSTQPAQDIPDAPSAVQPPAPKPAPDENAPSSSSSGNQSGSQSKQPASDPFAGP